MDESSAPTSQDAERVFQRAAELFGLLSSPLRLRIVSELCRGELNVGQLLERIDATQPNMSQHLAVLHRAGVLARRRKGTQVRYRIGSIGAAAVCRSVCVDLAIHDGAA